MDINKDMINKLEEAKEFIEKTDKTSKDYYVNRIDYAVKLLNNEHTAITGRYEGVRILEVIKNLKNTRR